MFRASHNQRGFTIIEASIALAVAGLIIGGVWAFSATAILNMKKAKFTEQIVQVINNVHRVFGNSDGSAPIDQQSAILAGVFPDDMLVHQNTTQPTLRHVFDANQSVTIKSSTFTDGIGNVTLMLLRVPPPACIELLSRLGNTVDAAQNLRIKTISTGLTTLSPGSAPIAPDIAAAACTGENNPTLDITIAFGLR